METLTNKPLWDKVVNQKKKMNMYDSNDETGDGETIDSEDSTGNTHCTSSVKNQKY